jgi:hypothetical protein
MCLSSLLDIEKPVGVQVGYKVFNYVNEFLYGVYYTHCNSVYKKNQWIEDKADFQIRIYDYTTYPTGFHIFTTYEAAEQYRRYINSNNYGYNAEVWKVEYANITTIGAHKIVDGKYADCHVAKRMKIIEKIESATA